jgi:outer membrane protein assembly factor BamB
VAARWRWWAAGVGDGQFPEQGDGVGDRGNRLPGPALACRYDQAAVTVCTMGTSLVFALDATSGKQLWQLPTTGWIAPTVTAAWHGAVYGTAGDKPLVLDAKTGVDREPSPALPQPPSAATPDSSAPENERLGRAPVEAAAVSLL